MLEIVPVKKMLSDVFGNFSEDIYPKINVSSQKDAFKINIDMPGVNKDDVDITVNNNILIVKGERKYEKKCEDEKTYYSEIEYGKFQRSIELAKNIDVNAISAQYANGILSINVPKKEIPLNRIQIK